MITKIRTRYDLVNKEPFIQLYLNQNIPSDLKDSVTLEDEALQNFCEIAGHTPILLTADNSKDWQAPQIRIVNDNDKDSQGRLAETFENWTKQFFFNMVADSDKSLPKTFNDFFNHLYDCIDPEKFKRMAKYPA